MIFIIITTVLLMGLLALVFKSLISKERKDDDDDKPLTTRPIIGILAQDTTSEHGDSFIPAPYVKYLEQAGARVVPIKPGQPNEYYKEMISLTNGILFTGGSSSFKNSLCGQCLQHIYRYAVEINQAGDYYPLWGTCWGFQALCYMVEGSNLLKPTDSNDDTTALDLFPGYKSSRLLRFASKDIIRYLSTEPTTQNQHKYGILPEVFETSKLSQFFNVISTNKDRNGQEYISTLEGKSFPFYGVQWHPEKNNFSWNPNFAVNHSAHAVGVTQYMANFFVGEARKNAHRFLSVEMEAEYLIQNYKRVYFKDGSFYENYYIDI